jgi:hypothetical protein
MARPKSDARLWHPWLRINRVLRMMLHTRWGAPYLMRFQVTSLGGLSADGVTTV